MEVRLRYMAPPTVRRFLESNARVRGVVGPFGSGKSSGCVVEGLLRSVRQKPGPDGVRRCRGVVVRNTYRELEDTTRKTFEQWWPTSRAGRWYEQDFSYVMQDKTTDIEVLFRALDKPEDVKKLLSLELTWAYINECREVPKEIFDGLQGRIGRYPNMEQGGPTWHGLWFDSNPWHRTHWLHELFKLNKPPPGFELYEQPSGLSPEAENVNNLVPGYYPNLCAGKDSEWVDCYVHGKYPSSDKGSVYGGLLADLEARGGLEAFEDFSPKVFLMWDLGGAGAKGDATGFWVFSMQDGDVDLVDYLEGTGKPLSFYFDAWDRLAAERRYRLERVFLPHDARAKSLQTGMSLEERFWEKFGGSRVTVLPLMSLADGIAAGRWLLEQSTRIHPRASQLHHDLDADGLKCLREYRYEWDADTKTFSRTPLHNWASHCADAFRGVAVVAKAAWERSRPTEEAPKRPDIRPAHMGFNLNELWETRDTYDAGKAARYR